MKCPNCNENLKKVEVRIHNAKSKVISYQCQKCDFFEFESSSSTKVLQELRDNPLKIKQKVVKLSGNRLGLYINNNIVNSLDIKKGEEVYVTVPDKKHILVELK